MRNEFNSVPRRIRCGEKSSGFELELAEGLLALPAGSPGSSGPAEVARIGDWVIVSSPRPAFETGETRPVYRRPPTGSLAVATGRVWIRFAASVEVAARSEALESAGFRIALSPLWAPNAAWVVATSGSIAESLSGCDRLRDLADMEHVEPELIRPSARR